jgi:hypothetical protein
MLRRVWLSVVVVLLVTAVVVDVVIEELLAVVVDNPMTVKSALAKSLGIP